MLSMIICSTLPPADETAMFASLTAKVAKADPFFFAIVDNSTQSAVGIASYLRIEPGHRVIEVGNILFTPLLQKTPHATEAMYLMGKHAFEDLGYRALRMEVQCAEYSFPQSRATTRVPTSKESSGST